MSNDDLSMTQMQELKLQDSNTVSKYLAKDKDKIHPTKRRQILQEKAWAAESSKQKSEVGCSYN